MKNLLNILILLSFLLASCAHLDKLPNDNVTEPVLKKEPKLIYPYSAQRENHQGTSTVIFVIDKDGNVNEARVHKSSGYPALDHAAENYCKSLEFTPAKQNGEAISSSMKWEIKFNLEDFGRKIESRVKDVKSLYANIPNLKGTERLEAQQEVLSQHDEVVANMKDGKKFNDYIKGVVENSIYSEWETVAQSFPLTFLLYHDFINRYDDFDSISVAKSRLEFALKQDVEFLQGSENITSEYRINKYDLIKKIKQFVIKNYPEFDIDAYNFSSMQKNDIS